MPIYTCTAPAGSLDRDRKSRLAEEITRIHCDRTGAPARFVHVHFIDLAEGDTFTAGEPSSSAQMLGSIREGRSQEDKATILEEMNRAWTEVTGFPEESLMLAVVDVPASSMMEAGEIMPEPGEEAEWLEGTRSGV